MSSEDHRRDGHPGDRNGDDVKDDVFVDRKPIAVADSETRAQPVSVFVVDVERDAHRRKQNGEYECRLALTWGRANQGELLAERSVVGETLLVVWRNVNRTDPCWRLKYTSLRKHLRCYRISYSLPSSPRRPAANGEPLTSTRFDAWRYKQYAYQLYPGEPSSPTKTALAGFDLSVTQNGDKAQVLLKAQRSRYRDVTMSVDKRDTVYFIETSTRDDPGGRENH